MKAVTRLGIAAGLALSLCGCHGATTADPDLLSMAGTWTQGGQLRDQVTGDSHVHFGTFTLTQHGNRFSGTGEQSGLCTTANANHYTGPLADPAPFAVTQGTLTDRTITFQRDICRYQGTFEAGNNRAVSGTATCTYVLNGVTYNFSGEWQAYR